MININSDKFSNYNPNFKAVKIAEAKNFAYKIENTMEIYRLEKSDMKFLTDLKEKISYKDLFPKITASLQERWQKVFNYCVEKAMDGDSISYIAIKDKKPCGIMVYQDNSHIYLDGICSIPTEKNSKEPYVGKTLFYQIFQDAQNSGTKNIQLKAVEDGPFDVISKYKQLGFISNGKDDEYTQMSCNKGKFQEILKQLSRVIDYKETKAEHIDLNSYIA